MSRPRIKLPESAKVGDVIEVKTLISRCQTLPRKEIEKLAKG